MLTTAALHRPPGRAPARPAAASSLAPAWLHGPAVQADVVAVFASSAYLLPSRSIGGELDDTHTDVLPLLARGALALPGGLRVTSVDHLYELGLVVGGQVLVGQGRVRAPRAELVVRRTWRPPAVHSAPLLAAVGATVASALLTCLDVAADRLPDGLPHLAGLTSVQPRELVGLGPGLTPAGDDVLCGVLLGLRATGQERARVRLGQAVVPLLSRTTALSATLLRQADAGYAVPPVLDLLHAWHHAPDLSHLIGLGAQVAAVGHSSGPALLLGLAAGLAGAVPGAGPPP